MTGRPRDYDVEEREGDGQKDWPRQNKEGTGREKKAKEKESLR